MALVHIRYTGDDYVGFGKYIYDKYRNPIQPALLVRHTETDKVHYHSVFCIKVKKVDTVRMALAVRYSGNREFSIKKCDNTMFQYILHPGSEVVFYNMISLDRIEELRKLSADYLKRLKDSVKKVTKSRVCLKQELFNYFENIPCASQEQIAVKMCEICIEHKLLLPTSYYGKQLVWTVYANTGNDISEIASVYITNMNVN